MTDQLKLSGALVFDGEATVQPVIDRPAYLNISIEQSQFMPDGDDEVEREVTCWINLDADSVTELRDYLNAWLATRKASK